MTGRRLLVAALLAGLGAVAVGAVSVFSNPLLGGLLFLTGGVAVALAVGHLQRRLDPRRRREAVDEATGVIARRGLSQVLGQRIALAARQLRPLSIVLVEIDDSAWGLEATVPTEIALLRGRALRASDLVGRVSRRRFLLLLDDADDRGATEVVERIDLTMGRDRPSMMVRASIATYPRHGLDADALFTQAEKALERGARAGQRVTIAPDQG